MKLVRASDVAARWRDVAARWQDASTRLKESLQPCMYGLGIVATLTVYGLLQERIMTRAYGPPAWDPDGKAEIFSHSLFLVLMNRVVTAVTALALCVSSGTPVAPAAPVRKYAAVSVSNVLATFCQYEALKWISFPVQTLGKTAKVIPVMAWGAVAMGKKYTSRDVLQALVLTAGCTAFVLTGDTASGRVHSAAGSAGDGQGVPAALRGASLMAGYLAFDGFTSSFQEKLYSEYDMAVPNQMLYINLVSAALSLSGLVLSRTLIPAVSFVLRHPTALAGALVLSTAAACAQLLIGATIKRHGAVCFAIVMTTRQIIAIVASCVVFAHPLTTWQGVSAAVVFATLYMRGTRKRTAGAPPARDAASNPDAQAA